MCLAEKAIETSRGAVFRQSFLVVRHVSQDWRMSACGHILRPTVF
jgi:hypothetical protein